MNNYIELKRQYDESNSEKPFEFTIDEVFQAADKEIARIPDYQETVRLLRQERRQLDAELARLREALEQIIRWDGFPESGRYWEDGRAMSYSAAFGSNGERDYMRTLAQEALKSNDSEDSE